MHPTRFLLPSLALAVASGLAPAAAQQVITRRPPRAETGDTTSERAFRRLQIRLDSLTHLYNESEDITAAERRRVAEEIARTVAYITEQIGDEIGVRSGEMRMRQPLAAGMQRVMLRANMLPQFFNAPRGWIGIVVEGPGIEPRAEGGELIVRYLSYPRIVSVDPSSPAQRAGLVPNDTLLAYDGSDVRENDISLNRLLRPGAKVSVRVRRDGRPREFAVTVAEAPSRIVQRRGDEARDDRAAYVLSGIPDVPTVFPRMPAPSAGPVRATSRAPMAAAPPPVPPMPAATPFVFGFSVNGVAGAQLTTISEGLGRTIGVSSGVLVTNAPAGSPASESGLTDGDVIVKVSGQPVRSVLEVRQLVGFAYQNGERSVEIDLLRQKKPVKTTLRW